MGHFTIKAEKTAAFCPRLSQHLISLAANLDNPSEDKYYYMDDDEYERDYFMKYNLFFNHIDRFFGENPDLDKQEIMKKIISLFE